MPVEAVDQDSVLDRALELVKTTRKRIWITSPWITQRAVNLLLRDVLPKVEKGLEVRIVYRVKEPADLECTDLEAFKALEDSRCQVRYSTRLHAKHGLVADQLRRDSEHLERAGARIADWISGRRPFPGSREFVVAWEKLLSEPLDMIIDKITSDDGDARGLRQNRPFNGMLGREAWLYVVGAVHSTMAGESPARHLLKARPISLPGRGQPGLGQLRRMAIIHAVPSVS